MHRIAEGVLQSARSGKKSNLILVAEGAGKMEELCREFEAYTGIVPRQTRLGYIQRGGSPTHVDRLLAARFATAAVRVLEEGGDRRLIGLSRGAVYDMDMTEALSMKKTLDEELYREVLLLG